jgi:hypothetical protein
MAQPNASKVITSIARHVTRNAYPQVMGNATKWYIGK